MPDQIQNDPAEAAAAPAEAQPVPATTPAEGVPGAPEAASAAVPASDLEPARQEALEALLASANAKAAENYDNFLRAKAEMENIRRRSADDVLKAQKFGIEKMAEALLAVKDSLDAALKVESPSVESYRTGVELTARQLAQVFEKFSIAEVDPAGAKFDPTRHQAIAAVESDQPANTVVDVMQKGYLLHERVLRPALVAVAKEKADGQSAEPGL
jgi:molecular chaperone GrpE